MSLMKQKEAVLKISEAFQQDVGYGRARIDHQTRMNLDLSIGDVITIEGTKTTAAMVWRAHPTDEGKGIIRIDNLTRKFPREELYILTSQIKRAADSIALNVAEGSTGQTNAEFRQFLGYAIRSAIEVVSCLYIGRKRRLINDQSFQKLYNELETIVKMLQSLRNSLK